MQFDPDRQVRPASYPAPFPKTGLRGRPRMIEDMRAYKAAKAKEYRRLKAAKEAK
jgi:hypothetical protein